MFGRAVSVLVVAALVFGLAPACTFGSTQTLCWAELDQYLMEEVVPWIPLFFRTNAYPVSERVTHGSYDQRTGLPALDRIGLVPGSE